MTTVHNKQADKNIFFIILYNALYLQVLIQFYIDRFYFFTAKFTKKKNIMYFAYAEKQEKIKTKRMNDTKRSMRHCFSISNNNAKTIT